MAEFDSEHYDKVREGLKILADAAVRLGKPERIKKIIDIAYENAQAQALDRLLHDELSMMQTLDRCKAHINKGQHLTETLHDD